MSERSPVKKTLHKGVSGGLHLNVFSKEKQKEVHIYIVTAKSQEVIYESNI